MVGDGAAPLVVLALLTAMLAGLGPAFDTRLVEPGERVEGYTNFLWGMIAYGGMFLGAEPIQTSAVVGWIAQFLTVLLVYDTGRRLGASAWGALVAPALLCVHVGFLAYPTSGMETTFHVFLNIAARSFAFGACFRF